MIDTVKIAESMANDILALSRDVLVGYSLKNSVLYEDASVEVRNTDGSIVVDLLLNNYVNFIEKGRKPLSGKKPPIDALRDWALRHNIPADNSTLWAISTAIQRDGYEARPILATLEQQIESYLENEWSDKLFEILTDSLNEYFK